MLRYFSTGTKTNHLPDFPVYAFVSAFLYYRLSDLRKTTTNQYGNIRH